MKVTLANYNSVHVELSHEEFRNMTGFTIGDHYGNHGTSHEKTINKEFNLQPVLSAIYSCKQINETRARILNDLEDMKTKIKEATFIISAVDTIKNTEVKK